MDGIDIDLMQFALTEAQKQGVTYADVKWMQRAEHQLRVKNEVLEHNQQSKKEGLGIKILFEGGYGFAATNQLDKTSVTNLVNRAFRVAKGSAKTMKKPIELAPEPIHEDKVETKVKEDPRNVDHEEIISLLVDVTKAADINDNRVKVRTARYEQWTDRMILWTSEGTKIDQTIHVIGGGGNVIAVGGGDTQQRGFPNSVRGDFSTSGFEFMRNMGMIEQIPESAKEAIDLLDAPKCPSVDKATVIIHPGQLFLHLHENGHGFEMDRAYDYEAAFAGTSFLKPHLLNELNFGNELVTIHADATKPNGLGTFFYDHEGVAAQKTTLVDKGKFVGYMSSRETAGLNGWERSSGSARARTYDRMPLIRMTNINLQPGDWDYQEMIEDTKDGYMMDTNVSWSIDDLRLSFQFGCEIGWRIENGEITGLLKNPSYTGITPRFWNSVNAVANEKSFKMFGTPNCGKGEPSQIMYTGHGASPVRFEDVRIGVY